MNADENLERFSSRQRAEQGSSRLIIQSELRTYEIWEVLQTRKRYLISLIHMTHKFYSETSSLKSLETKFREQDALLRNAASSINTSRMPYKLIADQLTSLPGEYKQLSLNDALHMCFELADNPRDFVNAVYFATNIMYLENADIYDSTVKYVSNGQWGIDNINEPTIHFVRINQIDIIAYEEPFTFPSDDRSLIHNARKYHSAAVREPTNDERTNLEAIVSSFTDEVLAFLLSNGVLNDQSDNNQSDISSRYDLFGSSSDEDSPRLFDEDGRLFGDESMPDLESMNYNFNQDEVTIIQTDNTAAFAAVNNPITPNKEDNNKSDEEEEVEDEERPDYHTQYINPLPSEIQFDSTLSLASEITTYQFTNTNIRIADQEPESSIASDGLVQRMDYNEYGLFITSSNQVYNIEDYEDEPDAPNRLNDIRNSELDKLYEGDDEEDDEDSE